MTRKSLTAALLATVLVVLSGCSSIDSEIRALRAEEDELVEHIRAVTEVRKKTVQLQTALQQLKADDSAANERAVEEARRELEAAKDAASRYT